MYTLQALWTMARERLNVVTVIFNNASYAILNIELSRVGVRNAGPKALSMLSLDHPRLDWCALASGMGVPAERVTTVAEFRAAFARALDAKGPALIEAML
jgi:acetolactate synthase-1/2/3 large subunit